MAASLEDFENGFTCQQVVVNKLNRLFESKNFGYKAEETDAQTDMNEKYDIRVFDESRNVVRWKFDVKSTRQSTGNISYTLTDNNGKSKPTNSKEENKLDIRLIFIFGANADTIYVVNMDKWYELLKRLPVKKGRIYVMKNVNGVVEPEFGIRQGKKVNLKDYYHVTREVKDVAGEEVKTYVGRARVKMKMCDVELEYDTRKNAWYFEGGSEYVVVSEAQIKNICDPRGIMRV